MKKLKLLLTLPLLALMLGGCGNETTSSPQTHSTSTIQVASAKTSTQNDSATASSLAKLDYQSGKSAIIKVNDDHSTLDSKSWKTNHIDYSKLDYLNRTSNPAMAYLEQRNLATDNLRTQQTVKPTGWHQKFDQNDQPILNRGHIIAYSLSKGITDSGQYDPNQQAGDQNNLRNLFTQTAFSNQELQTIYETKVRKALEKNEKVVYRVQPIFEGNDLMAKGIWMQAISTNKLLNFNVYVFNVQPGYKFDYANGTSVIDNNMKVPTPPDAPYFNNNKGQNGDHYNNHYNDNQNYNGQNYHHDQNYYNDDRYNDHHYNKYHDNGYYHYDNYYNNDN